MGFAPEHDTIAARDPVFPLAKGPRQREPARSPLVLDATLLGNKLRPTF
jgi:hypothetical protein